VERTIPALHTVKVSLLGLFINVSGLVTLNPDRSFLLNADPDKDQGFWTKNFRVKNKILTIFSHDNPVYIFLNLHEERQSCKRTPFREFFQTSFLGGHYWI